jgi:hypothetical protein
LLQIVSDKQKTSVSASDMFQTIVEMRETAHLKMTGRWEQFGIRCQVTQNTDTMADNTEHAHEHFGWTENTGHGTWTRTRRVVAQNRDTDMMAETEHGIRTLTRWLTTEYTHTDMMTETQNVEHGHGHEHEG